MNSTKNNLAGQIPFVNGTNMDTLFRIVFKTSDDDLDDYVEAINCTDLYRE